MNLPNKLTVARLVFTVLFLFVIFLPFPYHMTVALVFFALGGITDHLDGRLARKYNLITNFGILMDSLADKIFTCSAFIAFVELGRMAAWMVVIIVARELAITGMRLLAASRNVVLAAEGLGKAKTVTQIVCISVVLADLCHPEWGAFGRIFAYTLVGEQPWVTQFAAISKWAAVGITFLSGAVYLWRNREIYLQDM